MTSRRIFATRSHIGLSNLILDKLLDTSENKQHLRVIDDRDTQDMRERERAKRDTLTISMASAAGSEQLLRPWKRRHTVVYATHIEGNDRIPSPGTSFGSAVAYVLAY